MGDSPPLRGRSAVITGGSKGIGYACADALASAGARVVLLARDKEALDRATKSIGRESSAIVCDVGQREDLDRAMREIRHVLSGVPDILVNNAARFMPMRADKMSLDEFELTLRVSLIPYFAFARGFLDDFLARGTGHIVSIGSIADRAAYVDNAAYSASKFGVRGLHEVLRQELRGTGVRTTLISPASVDTPIWDPVDPGSRVGHTPREKMLDAAAVADAVLYAVTRPAATNVDELRLSRS